MTDTPSLCPHFSVHHIMVVKENAHRLSIYAEEEPEDHVSHLAVLKEKWEVDK